MTFLFRGASSHSEPLQSTLLTLLHNALPSSVLSSSDKSAASTSTKPKQSNTKYDELNCYYGDTNATCLEYFYGSDIPKAAPICANGLFSYGDQTQMHSLWFISKYPYFNAVAFIYSFLFLWFTHFRIRIISIIIMILLHFTIGESLKIERHSTLRTFCDKLQFVSQLIGDFLLIPYHLLISPSESPLIQFQDTAINRRIFSNCNSILKFSPTFWAKNILIQFLTTMFEEQFSATKKEYRIYRESVQTHDNGLIALDHWTHDSFCTDIKTNDDDEYASFGDIYESKIYYQYDADRFNTNYCFINGDKTPIIFIFCTYCGDSLSIAVRRLAEYCCMKGWRVISYTKRGCGSPYYEILPLTNHQMFDISGMHDAHQAVQRVTDQYPFAHKICVGFSLGGSQIQDFLGSINRKEKHFIGGIKIDGMSFWKEMIEFNVRQNAISKILGDLVHETYCKIFMKDDDKHLVDGNKIEKLRQNMDETTRKLLDFDKIACIKSVDCEILDAIENIIAPAAGHYNSANYLHAIGPIDIERVNVPMLVINSWNDGFQDPVNMPCGIANINPNIFHCITRLGAHTIRREGVWAKDCWQSRVALEFAEAILDVHK